MSLLRHWGVSFLFASVSSPAASTERRNPCSRAWPRGSSACSRTGSWRNVQVTQWNLKHGKERTTIRLRNGGRRKKQVTAVDTCGTPAVNLMTQSKWSHPFSLLPLEKVSYKFVGLPVQDFLIHFPSASDIHLDLPYFIWIIRPMCLQPGLQLTVT